MRMELIQKLKITKKWKQKIKESSSKYQSREAFSNMDVQRKQDNLCWQATRFYWWASFVQSLDNTHYLVETNIG